MFREFHQVAQFQGEPHRRSFVAENLDLLVWTDESRNPIGFQLIYPTSNGMRAFTCVPSGAMTYCEVDDGSTGCFSYKQTRLLIPTSDFKIDNVLPGFRARAPSLDFAIADFIVDRLETYAAHLHRKSQA